MIIMTHPPLYVTPSLVPVWVKSFIYCEPLFTVRQTDSRLIVKSPYLVGWAKTAKNNGKFIKMSLL